TTTTATDSDARALAQGLVEARLAACVQVVGPITSVYRWEGEVQVDDARLCLAKTTRQRLSELTAWLADHHAYDVPATTSTHEFGGSHAYLRWVAAETVQ